MSEIHERYIAQSPIRTPFWAMRCYIRTVVSSGCLPFCTAHSMRIAWSSHDISQYPDMKAPTDVKIAEPKYSAPWLSQPISVFGKRPCHRMITPPCSGYQVPKQRCQTDFHRVLGSLCTPSIASSGDSCKCRADALALLYFQNVVAIFTSYHGFLWSIFLSSIFRAQLHLRQRPFSWISSWKKLK